MTRTDYTIEGFSGLNVISSPEEVGATGATSLLNVDFDRRGSLRARDGYTNHTSVAGATPYRALFFAEPSTMLAIRGGVATNCTLAAINSAGAVATSVTASPGIPSLASFASVGTTSATTTYIACSGFGANVKTWDGSAFANAAFTGSGTKPTTTDLLAAWGERLVAADIAANGKLKFSNAGNATIFDTDDYVIPDAGDGFTARALVAFGTYLLLFRETKMFSFYGVSVDGDGGAVFNYNRFVHGYIGAWVGHVVANDAVYVLTSAGLYKTTGSGPLVLVSEMPQAIFRDFLDQIPAASTDYGTAPSACHNRRLYFALPATGSSGPDRTLVYDLVSGDWIIWDIAALSLAVASYPLDTGEELMFGLASGHVGRLSPTATTDAGSSISWNYTTGRYYPADGRVAVIPETSLTGSGTVTASVVSDLYSAQAGSATLGTSPAVAEGWPVLDQEGTWLQTTLSGSGQAVVTRVAHSVSSVKAVGVR